jgi:hypothetical protein
MREQRKLAAVLAADVVGYTRLMGRDEVGTLARLKEHRAQQLGRVPPAPPESSCGSLPPLRGAITRHLLFRRMSFKPRIVVPRRAKPPQTAEALDIAARYLVYKLYVPRSAATEPSRPLSTLGEAATTVARAVPSGRVWLGDPARRRAGKDKRALRSVDHAGRQVARKALR